jgi:hypothetical protein
VNSVWRSTHRKAAVKPPLPAMTASLCCTHFFFMINLF